MLQTDEVDVDYFTPVASTSLANIFSNESKFEDKNTSLKYVPTPPQTLSLKEKESKTTEIVYACAFFAYEWFNNKYVSRGKVGAAILNNLKSGNHNVLLYDSNKVTLSCTSITPQLEMIIKGSTNISYYDNNRKYWSIYGTELDTSRFIEQLKLFDIQVTNASNTEKEPNPTVVSEKYEANISLSQNPKEKKESDTDSSINKRTKESILKRMSSVGHSVLPMQSTTITNSSDSSDSIENSQKIVRHKPHRVNNFKRNFTEKDISCSEIDLDKIVTKLKHCGDLPTNTYDQQLVPIKGTKIITNPITDNSNNFNLFMSEQRISNSELRITMNRMADKIDKILENVQGGLESNSSSINFKNNVVLKLLTEYENKIKSYEQYLKSNGLDCPSIVKSSQEDEHGSQKDLDEYKNKIQELEKYIQEKDEENCKLKYELASLQGKYDEVYREKEKSLEDYLREVNITKQQLHSKNEELLTLSQKLESISLQNITEVRNKVKLIMNNTFHSLSANFDNNENYTGNTIKSLMANVIKKETIEALNKG